MFNDPAIGLIVYIAAYLISRIVSEGALRKLSIEQKAILIDAFSTNRIYGLIFVFAIMMGYLLSIYFFGQYDNFLMPFFFGILIAGLLAKSFFAYRKLRALEMPASYVTNFWLSSIIQYVGLIFFLVSTMTRSFGS